LTGAETGFKPNQTAAKLLHKTYQGGHKPGKPWILGDVSGHGKLMEFSGNSVQMHRKIKTNKTVRSNICAKHCRLGKQDHYVIM